MHYEKIDIRTEGSQEYARLYTYFLDITDSFGEQDRPCVLICPGGGYTHTSDREAEPVAMMLNYFGYHAAVLRYSCAPSREPVQLIEAARSLLYLRQHAAQWKIIPDKIAVLGFSAGAHLAASLGAFYHDPRVLSATSIERGDCAERILRPDAEILGYPVISLEHAHKGSFEELLGPDRCNDPVWLHRVAIDEHISEDFPPTFVWHTFDDEAVPVFNSIALVQALAKSGVSCEYHLFDHGVHGLSLSDWRTASTSGREISPSADIWPELLHRWLERWKES